MNLTPNEIHSIEEAGTLDHSPVKMIKTKGGFFIAVGKPQGKFKEEALSAGSHPAIVKYNLEKQYPNFQPSLMKSEFYSENSIVQKHSHFLSDDLRKSGYDIYSVQNNNSVNFQITKYNVKVAEIVSSLDKEHLTIKSPVVPARFNSAMASSAVEKALECKVGLKIS